MTLLALLISWLNSIMSALFGVLAGPMAALPAWLSLTLISAVLGVLMLILFKYTSNQRAISRVRDRIKARLLAMKLFKDNVPVVLRSQLQVFTAALMLLVHSIPPMLVMALPFCLVLGQLSLWYQARPLNVDEQAVVVMQLSDAAGVSPQVSLLATDAARVIAGPVRVPSKHQIYWQIQPLISGMHHLQFDIAGSVVQKQLTVGPAPLPVSVKRPALSVADLILYPAEKPFDRSSPVDSIRIAYPDRTGPLTGSGVWVITLFVVSMLFAFLVKPFFNVKI